MGLFNNEFIPLLSGKPLETFSPEEFKSHVRSLKIEPPPKKPKKIKIVKHVSWSISPKKKLLSLKILRTPRWITRAEIEKVSKESGRPENEVWVKLRTAGVIIVGTEEEWRVIEAQNKEIK